MQSGQTTDYDLYSQDVVILFVLVVFAIAESPVLPIFDALPTLVHLQFLSLFIEEIMAG